jgi:hypothetical protein
MSSSGESLPWSIRRARQAQVNDFVIEPTSNTDLAVIGAPSSGFAMP